MILMRSMTFYGLKRFFEDTYTHSKNQNFIIVIL